ncbi:amino acid/amide ABC transporter ATP-binding protein 2, HAAT family [Tistlia consotensis]|uniref:Amino acid/amide ABC transporter ATP-binding protein 2, HAAT family n=1 Tax=Tistlia consotensis USBA 355 TaxID=560819 RepID=A0A1Y6CPD4_9PROT|nr:ABC transporter ATP-binding protein [Tistlia consotensis]SMF80218.1 amino acid/amide ABC transporter ATP-binding protein 2, HAAT family [Tistlia consotensis USBA 355]SNR62312.1 amino acid/amide ABC transporter ATP-binding protein 2, HAAT family [Tistlia consotensis]
MLTVSGLHTHYGLSHVIQGIDLEARPGEVVGIFGRNGVGKTTLLKTVAGWVKPTAGAVRLGEQALSGLAPDRVAARGVGFVPEDRRIFPGLTVQENIELGLLQHKGASRREERAAVAEIHERFPRLAERRGQLGNTLSGGEQQMLAIARVLVGRPRVVLIDEPSEGLAPMIVAEIFGIIRELKAAGAIVLLVEQNVHEALSVSDRFYVVERGRIVLEGEADSDWARERLMKAIAV